MMTPAYVAGAVKKISDIRGDDEAAHAEEDKLYLEILRAIASNDCDNPAACAQLAISTQELKFERWCA